MSHSYGAAVRDEVFAGGVLIESRISYGRARQTGNEIIATDRLDDEALRIACDAAADRARAAALLIEDARIRTVVRAATDGAVESTMTVAMNGVSIVTAPEHALADAEMLRRLLEHRLQPVEPAKAGAPFAGAPLLWRNGSAAVLLHEAAGHAAEHGHVPLEWPSWLRVRDGASDLLAGDPPRTLRRETFRDVPMPRMMEVLVEQHGAPFALPRGAVEIHLVAGGAYEPLTEMVTIDVAVATIEGARVSPFSIHTPRTTVASSILGASGDPIRYPGVICSREGQELFVASRAPLMVTAGLA